MCVISQYQFMIKLRRIKKIKNEQKRRKFTKCRFKIGRISGCIRFTLNTKRLLRTVQLNLLRTGYCLACSHTFSSTLLFFGIASVSFWENEFSIRMKMF